LKTFSFFASKKYFQRVLFSIMLAMALILIGLSVANTYVLERSVNDMQEHSNMKVLTQIQYNQINMNEMMTQLSTFTYKDPYLGPLLFSKPSEMEYIRGYMKMRQLMESSSFLQNIAIYNAPENELYGSSTDFLIDGGVTKNRLSRWLLQQTQPHPTSRLIPVSDEEGDNRILAFAFIVTDSYLPFDGTESAIIFFVRSEWVFDSLQQINGAGAEDRGDIYIRTYDGRLYAGEEQSRNERIDPARLAALVERDKADFGRPSGFVVGNTGESKSMVTYMEGIGEWTILYVQPYELVMKGVTDSRTKSLLLSGAFLLLAMCVSIWLSYKLYDPIEAMLRRLHPIVADGRQHAAVSGTELDAMSDNVLRLSETLKEISSEQIVTKYYIRVFLTDSLLFSHAEMHRTIEKHRLNISADRPVSVCVLRIDRFAVYDRNFSASAKKLYSFAIVNIAQEIMSRSFPCEAVDLQANHVALIVSNPDQSSTFERVKSQLRDIQGTIEQYYGISLSCGISDAVADLTSLSAAYRQAYQLSLYAFAAGYRSISTTIDVRDHLSNEQKTLPSDLERKLSEALKKGNLTDTGAVLERAFSLLSRFQYDDMRRAVSDLAWVVKNTAADVLNNRIVSISIDWAPLESIFIEQETLEEIYLTFLAVCASICEGQRPASAERNEWIADTVKQLIQREYADLNLSQQSIASTVKLSSPYLGKLFKEICGISITEYINEVRLRQAQELLLRTDVSISEIMHKCGYANQSYFFRLFKGKFGCTPKEYRTKHSIS